MTTHQEAFHFHDITGALRRRWKMITMLGLTGAALSAAIGFILPPQYTAKAQMVVEIPDTAAALGWLDEAAVETRVQLLLSANHLKRVLESLTSDNEHPAAANISYQTLERNLNVYKELRSRVIAVTYTDPDPEIAALVANKSATIYLDTIADHWRRERSDIKALDAQLPIIREKLHKAETTLQEYRTASVGSKFAEVAGTIQPGNRDVRQADAQRSVEREAAATAQLYENLMKRRQELASQEVAAPPEVRIASSAAPPEQPSSLNPFLLVPPATVIALILGAFVAIALDRLDTSIRSQEDVANTLGIRCVGLIPILEGQRKSLKNAFSSCNEDILASRRAFLEKPFSPHSEAIRSTVLSTLRPRNQEKRNAQIVLITSSVQGEGKTTLAVSFAAYAALLERKVLLIDFDFRNPQILEQLARRDETGAREFLEGRHAADLIKHHQELGIDYLPLTRHSGDPLPLLQCSNLSEQLKMVAKDYDCVIIDSAPLLGFTETRLLSAIADKILLVIQWGSTRRDMVQHAFCQLLARRSYRAVAVITKVDLKRHLLYRFGDMGEALARAPYYKEQAHRA
jgi:polysaccharide biosynthesis transport protein